MLPRRATPLFSCIASSLLLVLGHTDGAPINPNNILISLGNPLAGQFTVPESNSLFEFTPAGKLVQKIPFNYANRLYPTTENLRDIVVDQFGIVNAFNGTFLPFLTRYSPSSNSFTHRPFPTWTTPNTTNYGAIATYQNFIFAHDLPVNLQPSAGIIRVDSLTNNWIRFAKGQQYIDINTGLDGKLYAMTEPGYFPRPQIDVYDPVTLALLRTISVPPDIGSYNAISLAVDQTGRIFINAGTATGNTVFRLNPQGIVEASRPTGFSNVFDMDLDEAGRLILSQWEGRVIVGNTNLTGFTSFRAVNNPQVLYWEIWVSFAHALPPGPLVIPPSKPPPTPTPAPIHNILAALGETGYPSARDNTVEEFTPNGSFVRSFSVPYPGPNPYLEAIRDVTMDESGAIDIFYGHTACYLSRYNRDLNTFTSLTFPHWSMGNLGRYGIAAFHQFVFVNRTEWEVGIIRFDTSNDSAAAFEEGTYFFDLNLGLDGNLYGIYVSATGLGIRVLDPQTMSRVREDVTVSSEVSSSDFITSLAVDQSGRFFLLSLSGSIYRLDNTGALETSVATGFDSTWDIDVDLSGRLIIGQNEGRVILAYTDLNYDSVKWFPVVDEAGLGYRPTYVTFAPLGPTPTPTPTPPPPSPPPSGPTPVVTVKVNVKQMREGDHGQFEFRVSTPTPYALPLNVTIGGTATEGVDHLFTYGLTNGKVVIEPNQPGAVVVVQALGDLSRERKEKITMTIGRGSGYKTGRQKSAQLTILDVPPPP